jgi:hypothetical protein
MYRQTAQDPGSVIKNKRPPIQPTSKTENSRGTTDEGNFRRPGLHMLSLKLPSPAWHRVAPATNWPSQVRLGPPRASRARCACGITLKKSLSKVVDDLDPYPTNIPYIRGTVPVAPVLRLYGKIVWSEAQCLCYIVKRYDIG